MPIIGLFSAREEQGVKEPARAVVLPVEAAPKPVAAKTNKSPVPELPVL